MLRKNHVQVVQVKTREQCLENARIYPARWRVEGAQACDVAASTYLAASAWSTRSISAADP